MLLFLYVYNIYKHTQNLCHSRKEKKNHSYQSKRLKTLSTLKFQGSRIRFFVNRTWLTFILLCQCNNIVILSIPESKRLPASEQISLEHVQLCVQHDCCCIINIFQFFNGICKKNQEIANSECYSVYEIIDLGFIPINKSSFSTW